MRLDHFSNPVFDNNDIIEALYKGQTLSADMFVDISDDVKNLEAVSELKFWLPLDAYDIPLKEYDQAMQADWFMPDKYKAMDIEAWIFEQLLAGDLQNQRVTDELIAYKERNMLDLLRWLKYFVDTCRANNVVWGVGRGSSVASYILYIIGVHKVDSLKYNLDWQEFLR